MGLTAYWYVGDYVVSCAEMSELVRQELVVKLELYHLWAKQCPVDLVILFICHELVSSNTPTVTHINLANNLSSSDISSQW